MTTYWHPKTGEPLRRVRVECLFGSSFVFVTEGGERLHALAHADTRRYASHLARSFGEVRYAINRLDEVVERAKRKSPVLEDLKLMVERITKIEKAHLDRTWGGV